MGDPEAFEGLVCDNLGLVYACASRFSGRGVEYEELVSAGSVGLVKAARGFDPSLGFAFSTYAVPVILGEMRRLFRDGGAVKIGRTSKEKALMLLKISDKLRAELEREPTVGEVAEAAGADPAETAALLTAMLPPVSLTREEDAGEDDIPVEGAEQKVLERIDLAAALSRLDEDERFLVKCRYFDGMTQTRTGQLMRLTQVQVSRKEKRVLAKLRGML